MLTHRLYACVALAGLAAPAAAQQLVFADIFVPDLTFGSIQLVSASPDAPVSPVLNVGGGLRAVEVDGMGRIYFADVDTFAVRRCNLDGSNVQDVVTSGLAFPSALAIDPDEQRLYIADQGSEMILSCGLDGSGLGLVIQTPVFRGVAVDTINNKLYWSTSVTPTTGRIMRSNLDGSEAEIVVPVSGAVFKPGALAVDPAGGKIYWADSSRRTLGRANLDGTSIETIHFATDDTTPRGIDIDPAGGHVYWGEEFNFEGSVTGFIIRANLDGSEFTPIVQGGIGLAHDIVFLGAGGDLCEVDWDNTGHVNSGDIASFLTAWLASLSGGDLVADFNDDLMVNSSDISAFLAAWLDAVMNGC